MSKHKEKALSLLENPTHNIDFAKVKVGPQIGSGNFSSVYVGLFGEKIVAIKKQDRQKEVPEKHVIQELSILSHLRCFRHENIIKYYGAHDEISSSSGSLHSLYIILEFCQNGNLLELLLDETQTLSWKFRINLAKQAAAAILFMHQNNILHRDIKSSNYLLDSQWNCKLSDFGAARKVDDLYSPNRVSLVASSSKMNLTICGTERYMAPEMLFHEDYCAAVDVFSLGMVLFEMIKRKKVGVDGYIKRKPQNKFEIDMDLTLTQLVPLDAPHSLVLLAQQLTHYEVDQRPTAQDAYDWLVDLYNTFLLVNSVGVGNNSSNSEVDSNITSATTTTTLNDDNDILPTMKPMPADWPPAVNK